MAFAGNGQPLQSAAAHWVGDTFDDMVHWPDGVPNPLMVDQQVEQDLESMEAGSNPCP